MRKQDFTPGNSGILCDIPWKFQDQKLRPMEIPYEFFLNTTDYTPGNSTSFLIVIDPWNFHKVFAGLSSFNNAGNSMCYHLAASLR